MDILSASRSDKFFRFLIICAGVFSAYDFLYVLARDVACHCDFYDFKEYYCAAKKLAYNQKILNWINIPYHPLFAAVLKLFCFLFPYSAAAIIWRLIIAANIGAIVFCAAHAVSRMADEKINYPILFAFAFIALSFNPIIEDFEDGQINTLLVLGISLLIFKYKENSIISGLLLSVAIALKSQYTLFLLPFLCIGKFRILAFVVLFYSLWTIIASLAVGPVPVVDYFANVLHCVGTSDHFERTAHSNFFSPCIFAVLGKLLHDTGIAPLSAVKMLYGILSAALTGLSCILLYKAQLKRGLTCYSFFHAAILMLLICPFTERHHLIILIPVFCVMFFDFAQWGDRTMQVLLVLAYLCLGMKFAIYRLPSLSHGFISIFQMPSILGLFILYCLTAQILVRKTNAFSKQSDESCLP
jgi:hypothetical protein